MFFYIEVIIMTENWDLFRLAAGKSFNFPLERLAEKRVRVAAIRGLFIRKMKSCRRHSKFDACYAILKNEVIALAKDEFCLAIKRNDILSAVNIKTHFCLDYGELFSRFEENGITAFKTIDSFLYCVYREVNKEVILKEVHPEIVKKVEKRLSNRKQMTNPGLLPNFDPVGMSKERLIDYLNSAKDREWEIKSLIVSNLQAGQFITVSRIMDYLRLSATIFKDIEIRSALDLGIQNIVLHGDVKIIYRYKNKFKIGKKLLNYYQLEERSGLLHI